VELYFYAVYALMARIGTILPATQTLSWNITLTRQLYYISGGKGKVIPVQAWTGPEGSRRLRLPDLKTVGT